MPSSGPLRAPRDALLNGAGLTCRSKVCPAFSFIARSSFDQTPEPRRLSLDAGSTDSSSDALVAAYVVGVTRPIDPIRVQADHGSLPSYYRATQCMQGRPWAVRAARGRSIVRVLLRQRGIHDRRQRWRPHVHQPRPCVGSPRWNQRPCRRKYLVGRGSGHLPIHDALMSPRPVRACVL